MSPDDKLARLASEVRGELERVGRTARELRDCAQGLIPGCVPGVRMGVAGFLHSFYTGCEAILTRLARAGDRMPRGEEWHATLLIEAARPVEAGRPPILGGDSAKALDKLRRFRHFFRNSYGIELDVEKLRHHADAVPAAHAAFRADIEKFLTLLETA